MKKSKFKKAGVVFAFLLAPLMFLAGCGSPAYIYDIKITTMDAMSFYNQAIRNATNNFFNTALTSEKMESLSGEETSQLLSIIDETKTMSDRLYMVMPVVDYYANDNQGFGLYSLTDLGVSDYRLTKYTVAGQPSGTENYYTTFAGLTTGVFPEIILARSNNTSISYGGSFDFNDMIRGWGNRLAFSNIQSQSTDSDFKVRFDVGVQYGYPSAYYVPEEINNLPGGSSYRIIRDDTNKQIKIQYSYTESGVSTTRTAVVDFTGSAKTVKIYNGVASAVTSGSTLLDSGECKHSTVSVLGNYEISFHSFSGYVYAKHISAGNVTTATTVMEAYELNDEHVIVRQSTYGTGLTTTTIDLLVNNDGTTGRLKQSQIESSISYIDDFYAINMSKFAVITDEDKTNSLKAKRAYNVALDGITVTSVGL